MHRSLWAGLVAGLGVAVAACASNGGKPSPSGDADGGGDLHGDAAPPDITGGGGACVPSPGHFEVPGNGCDDDGDGTVDVVPACPADLPVNGDAVAFAEALDLCQPAGDDRWGIVESEFRGAYSTGTPEHAGQHGILTRFGDVVRPRRGTTLGVLSTGWAREFDDLNQGVSAFKGGVAMHDVGSNDDVPHGFPLPADGCPARPDVHDVIVWKVKLKVPTNAHGFRFDFDFWSGEWPDYVCSPYNDGFVAYLTSQANPGGQPRNISFDAHQKPVSVNSGFFDRCTSGAALGCRAPDDAGSPPVSSQCPGGEGELAGTGFLNRGTWCAGTPSAGGGATGWLTSTAPVIPGEVITLEMMIWDTGDPHYDSSVLLDDFAWLDVATGTGTDRPPQ